MDFVIVVIVITVFVKVSRERYSKKKTEIGQTVTTLKNTKTSIRVGDNKM